MKKTIYHLFLFFFLVSFSAFSQSRKQLEVQRKKLNSEISKVNRLIFDTKKKQRSALEDLKDINQKINVRNKLISTINLEAKFLSKEIKTNEENLKILNDKLSKLKDDYADMIFKSYKSKSQQSRVMFLLSSQNFHQAYKRLEYMKQYTSFRKKQGEEIVLQTNIIEKLNDSLLYQKKVKETLILSEKSQKKRIEKDQKSQKKLISIIKKRSNKYKKELRKKQNQEKKIAARIDRIIKNAIVKANRIAKKKLKPNSKSIKKNEFILSPEAKALAENFELNKGKLPWPVKEGLITRKFGVQPHPTLSGITINSTGLHFLTKKGTSAKSIFNGKVLAIQKTHEGRKNVLVQHGNYITAYNNLENTIVKTGDKIITGQKIGKVFTNKVNGKTKLIFVLFKNTKRLNPSTWILKP